MELIIIRQWQAKKPQENPLKTMAELAIKMKLNLLHVSSMSIALAFTARGMPSPSRIKGSVLFPLKPKGNSLWRVYATAPGDEAAAASFLPS